MSEPIKAGDLVMVTKSCCTQFVRTPVFTVTELMNDGDTFCCYGCGAKLNYSAWGIDEGPGYRSGYPLPWLKKIDPTELEERNEEATHDAI